MQISPLSPPSHGPVSPADLVANPASSSSSHARQSPAAQRKQVGAQFEAVLVRQLLAQSLGSAMGAGSGASGNVYGYMLTDVLAQKLTSGRGLGLGRLIEQQLTPRGLTIEAAASTQATP